MVSSDPKKSADWSWLKLAGGVCAVILAGNGLLLLILALGFEHNELRRLDQLREEKEFEIGHELKARVESAFSTVNRLASKYDEQTAVKMAKDTVAAFRFDDTNYVWIHQLRLDRADSAFMLVHAADELVNKDLSGLIDLDHISAIYHNGKIFDKSAPEVRHIQPTNIFKEFNRVCLTQGEGTVVYYWPKVRDGRRSAEGYRKVSFVKYFKKWNWVIGAGAYADHLDALAEQQSTVLRAEHTKLLGTIAASTIALTAALLLVVVFLVRRTLLSPLRGRLARVAAEQQLLLDTVDIQVWYLKDAQTIGLVNRAHANFLNIPQSDIEGRRLSAVYPKTVTQKLGACAEAVYANRASTRTEIEIPDVEGQVHILTVQMTPYIGETAGVEYVVCSGADITEHRRHANALKIAADAADSANRAKSEFLANMSHEIRTPMNGVIGMTEILLDTPLKADQLEYVETIRTSADALLTIINDILDFSKIEAGKLNIDRVDFNLRTVINETGNLLSFKFDEKGLELVIIVEPTVPSLVTGDPGRIRQILLNLLNNAVKFTDTGRITVQVTTDAHDGETAMLRFSITDTGIGIPEDRHEMLFHSFTQVDASTTRKYGGTGLGLSISSKLCELMGGTIGVRSQPGNGSTFWFTVKMEKQPNAIETIPETHSTADRIRKQKDLKTTVPSMTNPVLNHRKIRILLAEDNPINQLVALKILKKMGFQADAVATGKAAVEQLHLMPYHLVLMDCQMPEMDGYEATHAIRTSTKASCDPNIPIIALTANAMAGDREKCLEAGMDDFVSKPINPQILAEVIAKWLPISNSEPTIHA